MPCDECQYAPPNILPGNRQVLDVWSVVQRCIKYASTVAGIYPIGLDWLEVDFLTKTYGIEMSGLLLSKLQIIEKVVIEAALEKGAE